MNVGVNTFNVKKKLYFDFEGTLMRLKEAGFASLEPCVIFSNKKMDPESLDEAMRPMTGGMWSSESAGEKIRFVRDLGLQVVGVHAMCFCDTCEELLSYLPALRKFAEEHDIRYYVFSFNARLSEMREYVPYFSHVIRELGKAGVSCAYHNHETECYIEENTTSLDLIMDACEELKLELDVGWVKYAGRDPVAIMKQYHDRLTLLHLKDIRTGVAREQCFTAVGEGSIPLKEIMAEARNCSLDEYGVIIDQDDSITDIIEDLAKGINNIKATVDMLQKE